MLTGTKSGCNRLSALLLHSQFHPIVVGLQLWTVDSRQLMVFIRGSARENGIGPLARKKRKPR